MSSQAPPEVCTCSNMKITAFYTIAAALLALSHEFSKGGSMYVTWTGQYVSVVMYTVLILLTVISFNESVGRMNEPNHSNSPPNSHTHENFYYTELENSENIPPNSEGSAPFLTTKFKTELKDETEPPRAYRPVKLEFPIEMGAQNKAITNHQSPIIIQ